MKEENTLTAKEWLEKEGVYNSYINHSKQGEEIGLIQFSEIMENITIITIITIIRIEY